MNIKERLRKLTLGGVDRLEISSTCYAALAEIERQEEVMRTLRVELDIARSAVRSTLPEADQLTRHTITLQKPLPAMGVGDSLLLVIVPPR